MNTSLKSVIDLSNICRQRDVEMMITEAGITLTTNKHGMTVNKSYDLNTINIIALDHPIDIIIDMFLEEIFMKFKKAVY